MEARNASFKVFQPIFLLPPSTGETKRPVIVLDFNLYAGDLMQACAVQSREPIMQYGQSIADGDIKQGQIPRLLGMLLFMLYYI